jgi:Domain of unknown function (DUF1905)/Bacteriocin-protection, YdeI or OmpD-Associated
MVKFTVTILKFNEQGEKTGWSYIEVKKAVAAKLKPDNKKSFRVKGRLDDHPIKGVALVPMGEGNFIMAVNATMRKAIGKQKGATLKVELELDNAVIKPPAELMECLKDEPKALEFFNSLTYGHRNYFGNWIRSAKTEATKTKRIAQAVDALSKKCPYNIMIRSLQQDKKDLYGE